jgi:hypothetical protein
VNREQWPTFYDQFTKFGSDLRNSSQSNPLEIFHPPGLFKPRIKMWIFECIAIGLRRESGGKRKGIALLENLHMCLELHIDIVDYGRRIHVSTIDVG